MTELKFLILSGCVWFAGGPALAASNGVSAISYARFEDISDLDGYNFDGTTSFFNKDGVTYTSPGGSATASVSSSIVSSLGVPASAAAYTLVEAGKLGVFAQSGRIDINGYSDTNSRATASLVETLTFRIAGATATTVTPIVAVMSWHGIMQETSGQSFATFEGRFGTSRVETTRYYGYSSSTIFPGSTVILWKTSTTIRISFITT